MDKAFKVSIMGFVFPLHCKHRGHFSVRMLRHLMGCKKTGYDSSSVGYPRF